MATLHTRYGAKREGNDWRDRKVGSKHQITISMGVDLSLKHFVTLYWWGPVGRACDPGEEGQPRQNFLISPCNQSSTQSPMGGLFWALRHHSFSAAAITRNGVKLPACGEFTMTPPPLPELHPHGSPTLGALLHTGKGQVLVGKQRNTFKALSWISRLCLVLLLLKVFPYSFNFIAVIIL